MPPEAGPHARNQGGTKAKEEVSRMGNPAQMQAQVTPPAVLHLGAMKARHRTGRDGDLPLRPASPAETYGVNMPGLQTGEIFSPVEARYESLSVDGTKKAYQELNAVLDGLASQVVQTMERIVPYLAKMQSLLSQRGADRKMVLKKAGLPKWTQWAESYAKSLDCTVRTIQLHIKHLREGRVCPTSVQAAAAEKRANSSGDPKPPDWKTVLIRLINALEQCGDSLPLLAAEALHSAKEVLEATQNDSDAGTPGPDVAALGQISANRMSSELVIARADARHIPLPSNSVQCVITSPPYWGLRNYAGNQELIWAGVEGCVHEWDATCRLKQATPIAMAGRFGESGGSGRIEKPSEQITVIQSHASCYLCGAWRGAFGLEPTVQMYVAHTVEILRELRRVLRDDGVVFWNIGDSYAKGGVDLKPKDLCLMPQRIALAAQEDGWWARSDIIWAKPNPMPESVTDRPTDAYEHVLMLTKSERYYWNAEAVKEPAAWERWGKQTTLSHDENQRVMPDKPKEELQENTTRNPRNVWTFATQPYKGAHFATFPDKLPIQCIRAACPEKGCCRFCGTPWKRVTKAGWTPGCKCRRQRGITKPCLVLDPFAGAGTTGLAARELNQDCVLLDISADYVEMMMERLKGKKHDEADTVKVGIDSGDPSAISMVAPGCIDIGVGIVLPHQGLPAQYSHAMAGACDVSS